MSYTWKKFNYFWWFELFY